VISFHIEWLDATGVKDCVLARTWSRLVIEANGQLVTEVVDKRSESRRHGIYGSVFPMCRWIVENWWFLMNEACPFPLVCGSRELAKRPCGRAWVQRHSLLAAQEGGSLPDLTIFRDGDHVVARWMPDTRDDKRSPVRFVGSGEVRMTPEEAKNGLLAVVNYVRHRLENVEAPDVEALRRDFAGILGTTLVRERALCEWAARLGLDAHDPEEFPDELAEQIQALVVNLDAPIRDDLLDATVAADLGKACEWIAHTKRLAAEVGSASGRVPTFSKVEAHSAHDLGHQWARNVRAYLDHTDPAVPVEDMEDALLRLGWAPVPRDVNDSWDDGTLFAAVELSGTGATVAVTPERDHARRRLNLARAAFLGCLGCAQGNLPRRRLVTRAHTWDQSASRAFAAEFLAPAAGISGLIDARTNQVTPSRIQTLADHFEVRADTIRHQIENQRLGWISD